LLDTIEWYDRLGECSRGSRSEETAIAFLSLDLSDSLLATFAIPISFYEDTVTARAREADRTCQYNEDHPR